MSDTPLRISLVIPVYNEESHLRDCLRLAIAQLQPFYEIIVVDNNSTDTTRTIAQSFPGVRVISEAKQGVVHARNRGFATARGAVIARIDGDTRLPADWTRQLQRIFKDSTTAAVSGAITYDDIACSSIINAADMRIRRWLSHRMAEHVYLLGSNMAIRQTVWQGVQTELCTNRGLHEDLDLAAHLGDYKVMFDPLLQVGTSGRRIDTTYRQFLAYLRPMPYTYAVHGLREQRYMYPVIGLVALAYLPLKVLYRGYDDQLRRFSIRKLLVNGDQFAPRVNPTSYID